MSCFGRGNATVSEPDAFAVLREASDDEDELLWKDRRAVLKQLRKLISGNVCVFKDSDLDQPGVLSPSWVPCTGRTSTTAKVEGFSTWVEDFPPEWEYGVLYVANPLKNEYDDRPDQKVPCFVLLEYDNIVERWQVEMFVCAMNLGGARSATITISTEDGLETSTGMVESQRDESRLRKGRFTLPRLASRRASSEYALDYTALEDYIRLFGAKMINSIGHNSLSALAETIQRTGSLHPQGESGDAGPPSLAWEMRDSLLKMLQTDLGDPTLKAGLPGALTLSNSLPLKARFKKSMVRKIAVEVWFLDNEDVKKALLEKLVGMESFMEEQRLFQDVVATLSDLIKARPVCSNEDEAVLARSTARFVLLGGRGVGKSAIVYTLKLLERLLSPPHDVVERSQLEDLLRKPEGLRFNKAGQILDRGGTKTTREYTVVRDTFGATDDGRPDKARLIVCDTPGMSIDPKDHTVEHDDMMATTWKYIASHIPPDTVEKISPLFVFRADEVGNAYDDLEEGKKLMRNRLLSYMEMLLRGLVEQGATLEDIVVIGTHADKLAVEKKGWQRFIEDVSEQCDGSVSSFLVHNFEEGEFKSPERNLVKVWEALRGTFLCNPLSPLKTRASPLQEALLKSLQRMKTRERHAMSEDDDGYGLAELFDQGSSLVLKGQN